MPILKAVYFMPGISVVSGVTGYSSSITYWSADKHSEIKCEEQKNGDVWLTLPSGLRHEILTQAISHRTRAPDVVKPSEPQRRGETTAVRS